MILDLLQIFLGSVLIFLIVLQQRGSEGGTLFGTQTEFFFKRRGLEEKLYYLTWILVFLFLLVSFLKII